MIMTAKRQFVVMLLSLVTVIAAACGPAAPTSIRIAANLPMGFDFGKESEQALRLVFSQAGYTVGRYPVELILTSSSPEGEATISTDLAMAAAKAAAEDSTIVAFIGSATSAEAKATIPITNRGGLAHLSISATWPGLTKAGFAPGEPGTYYPTGKRNFFRIMPADDIQGVVGARWAAQQEHKIVYVVSDDDPYSDGLSRIFAANAPDNGLTIVGRDVLLPDKIDALVFQVVASKADLVYYPLSISNSTMGFAFLHALRSQAPDIAIMGGDGLVSAPLPADTTRLEGISATQSPDAQQLGTADSFVAAYTAAYGEPPSPTALLAYEGGGVLLAALRKADPPTREHVLTALQNLDFYEGAFGRWRFDRSGDTTSATLSVWQLRNGRWQFVQVLR